MQNYVNSMDTRMSQNCACLTQIQQSRVYNSLEEGQNTALSLSRLNIKSFLE